MEHKVCRLCGENSGNLNIFDTDSDGIEKSAKIMYCCSRIEINENDGLSPLICNYCEQNLILAYTFVLKCEATDKSLRTQNTDTNWNQNDPTLKIEIKCEESEDLESIKSDNDPTYQSADDLDGFASEPMKKVIEDSHKKKTKCKRKTEKRSRKLYNDKGPQNCTICGRKCINPSTLVIHMRSHTNEKPYQCEFCNNRYKDPNTLKRHSERNHSKIRERKFICESCGKGFYTATEIITHLRTHTGETPYACPECPSTYTQLSSLIRHRKKHKGEKTEVCDMCPKSFCTKDQLRRHKQVHTGYKEFSCDICNSAFKYKHNLTKHHKLHIEPSNFVCNHCGRTFNTKGNLKIHIERVHSEKSGNCKVCSKMVSNIEVHMWKHTGERPLKCELCTKSFYEAKALSHHINFSHNHIDKHKCTIENCPRTFPSKAMLNFHIAKLHESRFVFPCDKCPRGFYRKNDLARHMIGTHKEKLL